MNVIRFDIEVSYTPTLQEKCRQKCFWMEHKQPERPSAIKDYVCKKFAQVTKHPETYEAEVQKRWNDLRNSKLKSLFTPQDAIAALHVEKIRCFVFHTDLQNISNKFRLTLEVIILSDNQNINHSVSVVFDEIKQQLNGCEVRTNKENFVSLFPYDRIGDDIWGSDYRIKANFSHSLLSPQEQHRAYVVGGITCLLIALDIFGNFSDATDNFLRGIYGSGGLFILTEVLLKHYRPRFVRETALSISINNLSTAVEDPPVPFSDEESTTKLTNPNVPA